MLALILSLAFGLSSGFCIANLFNKSAREPMKQLGINSATFMFMAFFGSQQNAVPFFYDKVPFENFYGWIVSGAFFISFALTLLVQYKKKATV